MKLGYVGVIPALNYPKTAFTVRLLQPESSQDEVPLGTANLLLASIEHSLITGHPETTSYTDRP
jgi:hypothetical protein